MANSPLSGSSNIDNKGSKQSLPGLPRNNTSLLDCEVNPLHSSRRAECRGFTSQSNKDVLFLGKPGKLCLLPLLSIFEDPDKGEFARSDGCRLISSIVLLDNEEA